MLKYISLAIVFLALPLEAVKKDPKTELMDAFSQVRKPKDVNDSRTEHVLSCLQQGKKIGSYAVILKVTSPLLISKLYDKSWKKVVNTVIAEYNKPIVHDSVTIISQVTPDFSMESDKKATLKLAFDFKVCDKNSEIKHN